MGLVLGFVGQINLGQAAFVAISAYTCSILRLRYGLDFWLGRAYRTRRRSSPSRRWLAC